MVQRGSRQPRLVGFQRNDWLHAPGTDRTWKFVAPFRSRAGVTVQDEADRPKHVGSDVAVARTPAATRIEQHCANVR